MKTSKNGNGSVIIKTLKNNIAGMRQRVLYYQRKLLDEIKLRKTAEKTALTDPLTEAFTCRGFDLKFNEEYANFMRYKFDAALTFFDVDNFKKFNSDYGQMTGDEVLKALVSTIKTVIRHTDSVHKIGGEEFVVLLSKINLRSEDATTFTPEEAVLNAYRVAERIRKKVEAMEVPIYNYEGTVKVTISGGVALLSEAGNKDLLVDYANKAEREAKDEGKNRIYIFYDGKIVRNPL